LAAERGVAAVMIAGVEADGELVAALAVAAVEPGVGPFVCQGAVKSLYLAVGLWPIWSGATVLDVAERIAEVV
jgi:hypothetical protein